MDGDWLLILSWEYSCYGAYHGTIFFGKMKPVEPAKVNSVAISGT